MVDSIYLSPHLDDVALSCGGHIYQRTQGGSRREVLIVTIMAGVPPPDHLSPFAHQQHLAWGFSPDQPVADIVQAVVQTRQAEDQAACRILGASFRHLPVPDCIYRRHPATGQPLYTSDDMLFGTVHPAEKPLIAEIAARLAALPPAGRIVAPLGIGHHVDHQLTRIAAEASFGRDLWYYEDYPYIQRDPAQLAPFTTSEQWQADLIPLSAAALSARLQAVAAYISQLEMLFSGPAAMQRALTHFIQDRGGECLWQQH
jgi:LmbE family N-acetylglucosaminyl deacetylase